MGFTVATWNSTALFGVVSATAVPRLQHRLRIIKELADSSSVVCLQEVHGSAADALALNTEMPHHILLSSHCRSAATGGVLTIISRRLVADLANLSFDILDEGRCTVITHSANPPFAIANLHLTPNYSQEAKRDLLRRLHRQLVDASVPAFVAGDFNFIASGDSRFSMSQISASGADDPLATAFDDTYADFTELHQGDYTRKQLREGRLVGMSRIDRIYCNIFPGNLADMRPYVATTAMLTDPTFPSDHVPVRAVLKPAFCRPPGSPRIPSWITDHPDFPAMTQDVLKDAGISSDIGGGMALLADIKNVLHTAARRLMNKQAVVDPASAHEQLHWALVLLRGARSGDRRACQRAVRAYPSLRQFLGNGMAFMNDPFFPFLTNLIHMDTKALLDSMARDPLTAEWKQVGAKEALRRRASAWADRRRTTSNIAVLRQDGSSTADIEEATTLMKNYWQPIFQAPITFPHDQDTILEFSATAPPDFDWDLTDDNIDFVLHNFRDSAPGPDGIPYSAWGRAHSDIHDMFKAAFCDFIQGHRLPVGFNASNIVFLPKGEMEGDYVQVRRRPEATRPISLSNSDAKLFARILNFKLSQLACITVAGEQRGFVKGRNLVSNIIETESHAMHISKHYRDESGIILFDFVSAFPSLSHDFIFAALHRLGVPPWMLRAIHALYTDCTGTIMLGGETTADISITAGIKQGCPASGTIFALALDPFIRMLCLRLPRPLNSIAAFADDLAISVLKLLAALRLLFPAFDILGRGTGLRLHPKKSLIIPIGRSSEFSVRRFLIECLPAWGEMAIQDTGKLLGIFIGPGGEVPRWSEAADKYWARAKDAKATCGGLQASVRHYQIFAVSVLSHLMQVSKAPKRVQQMENLAVQGLNRGPHNTFPSGALGRLSDIGCPFEAPRLEIVNRAALARAAFSSEEFLAARRRHLSDDLPDDSLLHPRPVLWEASSCFMAMCEAYDAVTAIPISIKDFPRQSVQACLVWELRSRAGPGPWPGILRRRLRRWLPEDRGFPISVVIDNITQAFGFLPASVVISSVRVLLNGLATPARMQGASQTCPFCGWAGGDRVEHLIHCSALVSFTARQCPDLHSRPGPVLRNQAMCFAIPNMSRPLLRDVAVFGEVLYFCYNAFKHGARQVIPSELAHARLRQLQIRHVSLRR
jgi:endonuclease/exonuclease/phosphatase family metal-dependent hydrolase